jgi:hypothetical protein
VSKERGGLLDGHSFCSFFRGKAVLPNFMSGLPLFPGPLIPEPLVLLTDQELPDEFKALTTYWKFIQTRFYRIGQAIVLRTLTGDEYAFIGKQKNKFLNISSEIIQR